MSRSSLQPLRARAAILVALWLALPLLGILHSSTHAHRFCPAHQTLEEITEAPESGAFSSLGTEPRQGAAPEWVSSGEAATAHERCALAWAGPRQAWLPLRPVPLQGGALDGSGSQHEGQACTPPVPLLSLAPKASPPAC